MLGLIILPMLLGDAFFLKMMEMNLKTQLVNQVQKNRFKLIQKRTAIWSSSTGTTRDTVDRMQLSKFAAII